MEKDALNKTKDLLTKGLTITLKKSMLKVIYVQLCYMDARLMLLKSKTDKLQALQKWLGREFERIKWSDKVSNDEVHKRVDETKYLMKTIWVRKMY